MGCSLELYNRDNGRAQIRDWQQVSVVLGNNMNELWSGFCAYAYDGNPLFDFMQGGPWDGLHTLEPTSDFDNLVDQLNQFYENGTMVALPTTTTAKNDTAAPSTNTCDEVEQELATILGFGLVPVDQVSPQIVCSNWFCRLIHPFASSSSSSSTEASILPFNNHGAMTRLPSLSGLVVPGALMMMVIGAGSIVRQRRRRCHYDQVP